jgi:hypothetical protein
MCETDLNKLLLPSGRVFSGARRKFSHEPWFQNLIAKYVWCKSISEIVFCIQNNINEQPICSYCNKNFVNFQNQRYKTTCSRLCSNRLHAASRIEKAKKTKLLRYGNEYYFDPLKVKRTKLEKYGSANFNNSSKRKQTNLAKYGHENYLCSPAGLNQIKQSNLNKRGVEHHMKLDSYRKAQSSNNILRNQKAKEIIFKIESILNKDSSSMLHQLASKIDLPYKAFIYYKRKYRIKDPHKQIRHKHIIFTSEFSQKLRELYKNKTHKEIADELGVSDTTIWRAFAFHGIESRAASNKSNFEKEVVEFIKNNYTDQIVLNDRKLLRGLELDIFIPKLNFAIECNGDYWHTFSHIDYQKNKNKHYIKTKACLERGIELLHLRESDWLNKRFLIESMLLNKLGINQTVIYARKCSVGEISHREAKQFLTDNHLQGSCQSNIRLGLFYNDSIVSVMTFGKSRFHRNQTELLRFASKTGHRVIGAASKLLSYYEKHYKPRSIITYADLEYSSGNLYKTLGFRELGKTKPGYMYFDGVNYFHRMNFQKKKLSVPIGTTEKQYVSENLGLRLYPTCGNLIFKKEYDTSS